MLTPEPKEEVQAVQASEENWEANEYIELSDGNVRRRKANKVQLALRVQQVATWLLDGVSYTEVVKRGQQKWGLSPRPVEKYISKAKEQIEASSATEIRSATTLAIYRLMELYQKAMDEGDFKVALDVIKTQNRMLGLNAPEKVETKTVENWDSKSLAEQFSIIEGKLKEKIEQERGQLN